jgi:hypothetical protein
MLIVLFLAAFASGALTLWLMWAQGLLVALIAAAVVASAIVAVLAVVLTALGSRPVTSGEQRPRGVLDILGLRPRR